MPLQHSIARLLPVPARRQAVRLLSTLDGLAARLPFLAGKERVYDAEFFALHDDLHAEAYARLANAIYDRVHPVTAVDVGCGSGQMLACLRERGVEVRGVEGSRHAIERSRVRDAIVRANLERGVPLLGRFDLCLCIEVAEHLPHRAASPLVAGLAALSDTVVFSAATPGQGGVHHVNEQPRSYWAELFRANGFGETGLAADILASITDVSEPRWIRENLMAFERVPAPRLES